MDESDGPTVFYRPSRMMSNISVPRILYRLKLSVDGLKTGGLEQSDTQSRYVRLSEDGSAFLMMNEGHNICLKTSGSEAAKDFVF